MKLNKRSLLLLSTTIFLSIGPSASIAQTDYVFESEVKSYPYTVAPAGESFHFEFENRPETEAQRQHAKQHVLQSLFDDPSIDFVNRQNYIRERAECSFFGGTFYDYTFCVLPHEFSPDTKNTFKGFVTQLPNSFWLLSRIVLPVILGAVLIYLLARKRSG